MGLSYDDLSLLRFIQKRQSIPLHKVAMQFEKNEISIRRAIEQINLYRMGRSRTGEGSHLLCNRSCDRYDPVTCNTF